MAMAATAVEQKSKTYTGQGTRPPKVGKHFLHIDDFSKEELWQMLQTSIKVADQQALTPLLWPQHTQTVLYPHELPEVLHDVHMISAGTYFY